MKFSIVVPTYNEELDIGHTLDALLALDYPDKEIVVVDDSTDRTPEIVRAYAERGVKLIRPEKREGRCGARNLGILEATGEIVIILNADVLLPPDFIRHILPYYEQGYDYVLVKSKVANTEYLFPRYVDSMAAAVESGDPSWMEWTEGFSCRRELAINAGLFPVGFAVPICAGEDGFFGTGLRRLGAKKKIDFDIVVPHIAPTSLSEYWAIRKGRGKGSPQIRRFLQGWSMPRIMLRAMLRIVKTGIYVMTVFPLFWVAGRAASYSPRGFWTDWLPFVYAWLIEQAAFHVGEWQSICEIARAERKSWNVAQH